MPEAETDLVERARAGGRAACDELFRRHARRVGAVVCARLGWRAPLEDLVQETFTRAWRELPQLAAPDQFAAWLRGIARNVCSDWSRRRGREPAASLDVAELELAAAPGDAPDEDARALLAAVEALPELYRETLTLYYFGERSHAEIAATLGLSPAAVNARLGKARALLRESLSRNR